METFGIETVGQSADQLTGSVVNRQLNRFSFGQCKGDFCGWVERIGMVL